MLTRRESLLALALVACKSGRKDLHPEDPIDESFRGCQKSCGMHPPKDATIVLQPHATRGDVTRCVVSGALFRIGDQTPQRVYGNRIVYVCCESCGRYFDRHADAVVSARGLV